VNQKKGGTADPKKEKEEKKLAEEQRKKELALLFKPTVIQPKVAPGVDPKSLLCQYFKQGQCAKGDKCKFSHDLNVERKGAKIDLYTDRRAPTEESKLNETSESWTQEKLAEVVNAKQTSENQNLPTTIVCKFFIEAVENGKYGWFWECPNGPKCQYRHALPPGYQLKKDKGDEDDAEEVPLEDLIEEERKGVKGVTAVTWESFTKWKADRDARKKQAAEKELKEKQERKTGMSGRELFTFNPDMFIDDDDAVDDQDYDHDEDAPDDPDQPRPEAAAPEDVGNPLPEGVERLDIAQDLFAEDIEDDGGDDDDDEEQGSQENDEQDDDDEDEGAKAGPSGSS